MRPDFLGVFLRPEFFLRIFFLTSSLCGGRGKVIYHTVVQRSKYAVLVTTQSAKLTSSLCGGRDRLCYVLFLDFAPNVTSTA